MVCPFRLRSGSSPVAVEVESVRPPLPVSIRNVFAFRVDNLVLLLALYLRSACDGALPFDLATLMPQGAMPQGAESPSCFRSCFSSCTARPISLLEARLCNEAGHHFRLCIGPRLFSRQSGSASIIPLAVLIRIDRRSACSHVA